ncbi:MAG: hypothetical protein Q4E42_00525 [Phascolarctobacterium sp.]|nr:hypothetical protein [Phascolarctobacterium sp.]
MERRLGVRITQKTLSQPTNIVQSHALPGCGTLPTARTRPSTNLPCSNHRNFLPYLSFILCSLTFIPEKESA